jgi:hypothetical protein
VGRKSIILLEGSEALPITLKHEVHLNTLFKNSVRTSKKTQPVSIRKAIRLMLFKEIIAVHSKNLTKPTNAPEC